jgi:hypothetical protein
MKVLRSTIGVVLVLALAIPTTATDEDAPSPLLEAVAYMAPSAEEWNRRFEFTDWSELKRLHDGSGITSDSPLEERQRLLLDIARLEAVPAPLGLDRLDSWKEAWGWDSTDLAWQAHIGQGDTVLRFGDHWDAAPFQEALLSRGYLASSTSGGTRYAPGSDGIELPVSLALNRVFGDIETFDDEAYESLVVIDVSDDGHTVIVRWGGGASGLQDGAEADLDEVATTPFGRTAATLLRPVASRIIDRDWTCPPDGSVDWNEAFSHGRYQEEQAALLRSVAPLHAYQALGTGYARSDADSPPVGRIVFVYAEAQQAAHDLPGRRRIIEEGEAGTGAPNRSGAAVTVSDAAVVGRELVIDVSPAHGVPDNLHMGLRGADYAMCGPFLD